MKETTGHIPDSFIEELLTRTDIVEVIGSRGVALKRGGANFMARCPFHTEKTPSFTVSPTKQFYHCFGCGAHGTAIRFLMEFDGIHFVEACEILASKVGLSLPTEGEKATANREYHKKLYAALEHAKIFFEQMLRSPASAAAVDYLKSRGITGKTAKQFSIGYAPKGWDHLTRHIIQTLDHKNNSVEKHTDEETPHAAAIAAGLVIPKEEVGRQRYIDRFRDRIMFPIRDRRGRVLGFGGRVIHVEDKPKYLNSPETPVFNKGKEVYGLYEAKLADRSLSSLIVVEGYLDVITLSQFGISNVVATLGTAISEKHLELLFRQVSLLCFCFDGDVAGKAAAQRAMQNCLPHMKEGRRVKFIFLPNGEDPDSFVRRQGKEAFLNLLQSASSFSDYFFESLSNTLNMEQIEGRATLVSRARPLIERLPKGILQQMMFERLAEIAKIPSPTVQKRYSSHDPNYASRNKGKNENKSSGKVGSRNYYKFDYQQSEMANLPPSPAFRAISMLLDHRNLLSLIPEPIGFQEVDIPGTSLLCAIIGNFRKSEEMGVEDLLEALPAEMADYFESIDLKSLARFVPESGIEAEFQGALERLNQRAIEQSLEILLKKAKNNGLTSDEKAQLRNLINQKEKNRVE